MGFGVRKRYEHKSRVDGTTTSIVYVCSNEGTRGKDKRDELTKNPRAETRTNCQVRLGVKFNRETNRFEVNTFVSDHNHLLQKPEACHLLRSQCVVPEAAVVDIELADETGVCPKQAHELMDRQTGGLSFSIIDHRNVLRDQRQRLLASGEAVAMLNYFHEQVSENPSFQLVEQEDEMQEITKIFWADAKMIAEYVRFGEVVVFDTTFGTNKEHRPFGVFVGFNHFREMVIFGATFMYNQTVDSFKWVFKTFIEVHNSKKPKTIFTDQDIAMGIAIEKVTPETTHGLCTWHVMENATRHLMRYNKKDMNILEKLSDCMYVHEEEAVFEEVFGDLVKTINKENSEEDWLPFIYQYKKKWAYCYMKNVVSLGIRSTQLSESINKDLKCYLKSDLNIVRLLKHFERVVNGKREKQIASDFDWIKKLPKIKVDVPILQQAGSLYTPKIFELFQAEYELSIAAQIEGVLDNEYLISISNYGNHGISRKCHKVFWNPDDLTLSCGCRMFERMGILCWHALKVLDAMNIKILPEKYIMKHWTREAENGVVEDRNGKTVIENTRLEIAQRSRDLCREFLEIAATAAYSEESVAIVRNKSDSKPKLKKKEEKRRTKKRKTSWTENLRKESKENTEKSTKSKKKSTKSKGQNASMSNSEAKEMPQTDKGQNAGMSNSDAFTAKETPQTDKGQNASMSNSEAFTAKEVSQTDNCSQSYMQLFIGCTDYVSSSLYGLQTSTSNQVGDLDMNLQLVYHHQEKTITGMSNQEMTQVVKIY